MAATTVTTTTVIINSASVKPVWPCRTPAPMSVLHLVPGRQRRGGARALVVVEPAAAQLYVLRDESAVKIGRAGRPGNAHCRVRRINLHGNGVPPGNVEAKMAAGGIGTDVARPEFQVCRIACR